MRHENGFTLVELSIVMIIIGLLIGGVLKGQQLIENSRINSTISQVNAYRAAINTFRDTYKGLPGDITGAGDTLAGCNAGNFCQGGNGNLIIGQKVVGIGDPVGGSGAENLQFWKHLALADLISGVAPGANPSSPNWGLTNPEAKLGGGFQVLYNDQPNFIFGHWLKLRQNPVGYDNSRLGEHPTNPRMALILDNRMDDGIPGSGSVQSHDVGPGAASGCEGQSYNTSFTSNNCIMLFDFDDK